MISYYYPPLNDVGILRTVGFAKHLPSLGWNPIILTIKNPDLHFCRVDFKQAYEAKGVYRSRSIINCSRFMGKLNGLLARILRLVGAHLEHELIPDLFLVPDFAFGWIPLTVIKGLQLIRRHRIDVIYATCKPNSSAIIGALLTKFSGKPLVIDLRDPWRRGTVQKMVGNWQTAYPNAGNHWKDSVDKILETKILKLASKVILTTMETSQVYLRLYPFLKNRIEVIYNGYSDDFFEDKPKKRFEVFTIAYIGSFYYYLDRSEWFFKALENINNDSQLKAKIRFLYIGGSSIVSRMIEKYNLRQIAHCTRYLPRKQAIALMQRANLIFLKNVKPYLSTKLFEGLASGSPFLAMVDDGEAADLIRKYSPSSIIVNGSNAKIIESAIRTAYQRWRQGAMIYQVNDEFKQYFSKQNLSKTLAKVLDSCIENNSGEKDRYECIH